MSTPWIVSPRRCRWCGRAFVRPPGWPWICETDTCRARCQAFAIYGKDGTCLWMPLPLQAEAMEAVAPRRADNSQTTQVLIGGAAGASKSHGARHAAYWFALRVPGCRILLLREVSDELMRSHILGLMDVEYKALGADFRTHPTPLCRWPSGSFIEGGHMEDKAAVKRYLSSEYDLIIPEEASLYDPDALMELTTRARTSNPAMLALGGARVWFPTNPGGPSSQLLRTLFLDRVIDPDEWPSMAEDYDPREWMHVPGRLDDNPYLDPSYERKLRVLRQDWRYKQLRFGDWFAMQGLFFDTFESRVHVRDLAIDPRGVQWFRSLDWGYHDPGVLLWWAVLDDGDCHIAAELRFRQRTPEELAPLVFQIDRELGLPPDRTAIRTHASPDMWARRGQVGEYPAETARRVGIPCTPATTDREAGWLRLQSMLRLHHGRPGLTIASRCRSLIRSLQIAQSDPKNPNDLALTDDHALESARYGAMSRPRGRWIAEPPRIRGPFDEDFRPAGPVRVGSSTRY